MENYTVLIIMVAIGVGFLDLLTDRWPVLQRQLFSITLVGIYFMFAILYYYGPDIWTYVPYYEDICTPSQLIKDPSLSKPFELGYGMFCSLLHWIGVSYWGLTVIIKSLYFIAIGMLLHRLPKRQMFALACIVLIDRDLITHENRQCLAVTFFIFMILLLINRKYLWALICATVTVLMHKTGVMPIGLTLLGIFFYNHRQTTSIYTLLICFLMAMVALPVQRISVSILQLLPLPSEYIKALAHHLLLGRQVQVVALIYLGVLLSLNLYLSYNTRLKHSWVTYMVLAGMAVVVVAYPYYFLLARLRSYFVPIVVYYMVVLMSDPERSKVVPYSSMIKQVLMLFILVYYIHFGIKQEHVSRQLHAPISRKSTVFELRHHSSQEIRNRQMKIAERYWRLDYMKENSNRL